MANDRKQVRTGDIITLTGYSVSKPKQGVDVQFASINLRLPGLPDDCPDYIWRNAVASMWITVQGKMRALTEQAIRALDGQTIDMTDLSATFEPKRATTDPLTKALGLTSKMTDEERAQLLAALRA